MTALGVKLRVSIFYYTDPIFFKKNITIVTYLKIWEIFVPETSS